jgi:hypothetical protein
MSNWAENPKHHRQSLMHASLPKLLFQECHKYCVSNWELQAAESESEVKCISNCQEKTYKAFDLYMATSVRFAAKKNYRHYVDVSKFTEMEVEHGHDTSNVIDHRLENHVHPGTYQKFTEKVENDLGSVKSEALKQ